MERAARDAEVTAQTIEDAPRRASAFDAGPPIAAAHRDAAFERVVAARSGLHGPAPAAGHDRKAANHADGVAPVPVEHEAGKFKIELGKGSVTGAVTLSLEYGNSGLPVRNLKLLKSTAALKLNGFVMKLETVLMSGKLEDEILDGVTLGFEVNAFKVGSDGVDVSTDLLAVAVKLSGNVGHWIGAGPDVKLMLEGQVQVALGGKLAAKLAKYTAANLERAMLAKEIEATAVALEARTKVAKQLEAKLARLTEADAARTEIAAVHAELDAIKGELHAGTSHIKDLGRGLGAAEKRAASALARLEGKLAKKIAWAMEKKVARRVFGFLTKALPILNVISTIIDVIDLIRAIKMLIEHGLGHGGGDEEADHEVEGGQAEGGQAAQGHGQGAADEGHPKKGDNAPGPRSPLPHPHAGKDDRDAPVSQLDQSPAAAHDALPLPARRIYDAVAQPGGHGPELSADQIQMIGLVIPSDLSPAEVMEITTRLRVEGPRVKTPEDVFDAIDQLVRDVRDRKCTVRIDGEDRPDLAHPADHDGPITAPAQLSAGHGVIAPPAVQGGTGPITSPAHVNGAGPITAPAQLPAGSGASAPTAVAADPRTIVERAPVSVIGHWFAVRDGKLELNEVGERWRSEHIGSQLGSGRLERAVVSIRDDSDGTWSVTLSFDVRLASGELSTATHHYFVLNNQNVSDIGSWVDGLKYERYMLVEGPTPRRQP